MSRTRRPWEFVLDDWLFVVGMLLLAAGLVAFPFCFSGDLLCW